MCCCSTKRVYVRAKHIEQAIYFFLSLSSSLLVAFFPRNFFLRAPALVGLFVINESGAMDAARCAGSYPYAFICNVLYIEGVSMQYFFIKPSTLGHAMTGA